MRAFEVQWAEMLAARAWFEARGYRLAESRGPEGMDSGFDRYERDGISILAVADRGIWSVEVGLAGDRRLPLAIWAVCIEASDPPAPGESTLVAQLDWARQHIATFEIACHPFRADMTRECLAASIRAQQLASFITQPLPTARDIQ